jgi:hypothetical protein
MMKFMDIEDKSVHSYFWTTAMSQVVMLDLGSNNCSRRLRELRNLHWVEAYQRNALFAKEKRLSLTGQVSQPIYVQYLKRAELMLQLTGTGQRRRRVHGGHCGGVPEP